MHPTTKSHTSHWIMAGALMARLCHRNALISLFVIAFIVGLTWRSVSNNVTWNSPTVTLEGHDDSLSHLQQHVLDSFVSISDNVRHNLTEICRNQHRSAQRLSSEKDFNSLFYKVNILNEIDNNLIGSPLDPIPGLKNPCWISVVKAIDPYRLNARINRTSKQCDGLSKELIPVFQERRYNDVSWRMRCLPYAMLIGVSKAGTTDFFDRLVLHPNILEPCFKELRFWNRQRLGHLRLAKKQNLTFVDWIDYFDNPAEQILEDQFLAKQQHKRQSITVEATPHYLWDYDGWQEIPANRGLREPRFILAHSLHRISPSMKFIVIIRNPTDRLYSQFRMLSPGRAPEVFHGLVEESLQLWDNCLKHNTIRGCAYNGSLNPMEYTHPGGMTLRAGMYSVFLEDWMKVFPREQFYISLSKDYYADMAAELCRVFSFLGLQRPTKNVLKAIKLAEISNSNDEKAGATKESMLPRTRRLLDAFYEPFNDRLRQLLGDKYSWN